MEKNRSRMKRVVERLPIFRGLSAGGLRKVLAICREKSYREGGVVCAEGDESSEFYVILSGSMRVETAAGLTLAVIRRMGVVGEMAALTGRPRTATVTAAENAVALCVGMRDLDRLIEEDKEIGLHIYRNLARILSDRLRDTDAYLEGYFYTIEELKHDPPA
jgi:CRP-like cAMP-binding protein